MKAVMRKGTELEFVPERLKTPELCRAAVRQTDWALKYVPAALLTEDMCRHAVLQRHWAAYFVPDRLKDAVLHGEGGTEAGPWLAEAPFMGAGTGSGR